MEVAERRQGVGTESANTQCDRMLQYNILLKIERDISRYGSSFIKNVFFEFNKAGLIKEV
jgi:hypothetical protein